MLEKGCIEFYLQHNVFQTNGRQNKKSALYKNSMVGAAAQTRKRKRPDEEQSPTKYQ